MPNRLTQDLFDLDPTEWYRIWGILEQAERSKKLDLSPWENMSGDELRESLGKFLRETPWALMGYGDKVSPRGKVYFDAIMELRDRQYEIEAAHRLLTYKGFGHLIQDIDNIMKSDITVADCGCCRESGGETHITFKNHSPLYFDYDGQEIL